MVTEVNKKIRRDSLTPDIGEKIKRGTLLNQQDVMSLWNMSRATVSRLTNHKNESLRLPAFSFDDKGHTKYYDYQELMHYRESHRFCPKRKKRRG